MSEAVALEEAVRRLKAEGNYIDAAARLELAGQLEEAARTLAEVWEYEEAVAVARRGNLYSLAYEIAALGDQAVLAASIIKELSDWPEQAAVAASFAETRGRLSESAQIWVMVGDPATAAPLFGQAGDFMMGARCFESSGSYREAGKLYERRLREAPEDAEAAIRLGSILASFGRYKPAITALQRAAENASFEKDALRLMVSCFSSMALDEAAQDCLARYRKLVPEAPEEVVAFLRAEFGSEDGLSQTVGAQGGQLLAGRYRVEHELGSGGSGKVLLAHDEFYHRQVAIKVLTVGNSEAGRDAYRRFEREARIAAALEHPQIVRVYEYNPSGPFIVMEYMAGGTLEDRLQGAGGHPLEAEVIQVIVDAVLEGLDAVHRRGIIHRDLKPANVFFDESGRVKLGDFGTAHLIDLGSTLTGAMLGTLAYMSPEQVTADANPVAATDFYAFGIMLFQMLTGRLPFEGPDFVSQHRDEAPPRPSHLVPSLGLEADNLILELLSKDVGSRPRSSVEIRRRLMQIDWSYETDILGDTRSASAANSVVEPDECLEQERWRLTGTDAEGPYRMAQDTLLKRSVWIRQGDEAQLGWLSAFAKADSPYLQAVFDTEDSFVVLESPQGEPLSRVPQAEWTPVAEQLRVALLRIHRAGLVHGSVNADHAIVAPGRAVLMLPTQEPGGTASDDLRALEELFLSSPLGN